MAGISTASDYKEHFDAEKYLEKYFKGNSDIFVEEVIDLFHNFFKSGDHHGDELIDMCSGPSLHSVISASKYYKKIHLTDVSPSCLDALRKWKSRDSKAFDWTPFFQAVATHEGNGTTAADIEQRMRETIGDIFPCDLSAEEVFGPTDQAWPLVAAITSTLTVDAVAPDDKMLLECFKKFSKILAPGGLLCVIGGYAGGSYQLGDKTFHYYGTSKAIVESKLLEAGYCNIKFMDVPPRADVLFFVSATKKGN